MDIYVLLFRINYDMLFDMIFSFIKSFNSLETIKEDICSFAVNTINITSSVTKQSVFSRARSENIYDIYGKKANFL